MERVSYIIDEREKDRPRRRESTATSFRIPTSESLIKCYLVGPLWNGEIRPNFACIALNIGTRSVLTAGRASDDGVVMCAGEDDGPTTDNRVAA